jgi:hypothetical protein
MDQDERRALASVGIYNGMLVNQNGVEGNPVKKIDSCRGIRRGCASRAVNAQ